MESLQQEAKTAQDRVEATETELTTLKHTVTSTTEEKVFNNTLPYLHFKTLTRAGIIGRGSVYDVC